MITRDEIKNYIEARGLDANVKIEGDQKTWKVTIKTSFEIPASAPGVLDPDIGSCLAKHLVRTRRVFDTISANI